MVPYDHDNNDVMVHPRFFIVYKGVSPPGYFAKKHISTQHPIKHFGTYDRAMSGYAHRSVNAEHYYGKERSSICVLALRFLSLL